MNKQILLTGDASSVYVKHLLEKDLIAEGWEVIFLDIYKTKTANIHYLKNQNIHYWYIVPTLLENINVRIIKGLIIRFFLVITCFKLFFIYRSFEVVNIQYLNVYALMIAKMLRPITNTVVFSFWGSDLLRETQNVIKIIYPKYFVYADSITFDSMGMMSKFRKIYGNLYDAKLEYLRYGNDKIEGIQKIRDDFSPQEIKQRMDFPLERVTIALGYNAKSEQQHISIIRALGHLDEKLKNNLFIVIPFSYGASNNNYIHDVEKELINNNFKYKFITDFLSDELMLFLYLGVDVFIHAQTTDALSQTIVNYLYGDTIILQGTWLHSEEIDRYKLPIIEFDTFDDLYLKIDKVLRNLSYKKIDLDNKLFYNEKSSVATKRWNKIFSKKSRV